MRKDRQEQPTGGYALTRMRQYTGYNRPGITFLNPHEYVTLKYVQSVGFSNATTLASQQIFNINSLFDPDRTGTGHQPYGFDQLAAMYNRYRVLKIRWIVNFGPTTNNPVEAVVVPVNGLLNSAIASSSTFENACELPFAKALIVPNAGDSTKLKVKGQLSLNELNGVTMTEYLADDRFESQVGSSPAEVITLYIGVYNPSANTVANSVLVELYYEVDFHDPIIFVSS